MDDLRRGFVYAEVMAATRRARGKLIEYETDIGPKPTKSEDKEWMERVLAVEAEADAATRFAMGCLDVADDRMETMATEAWLVRNNAKAVEVEDEDDDDDDDDDDDGVKQK